MTTYNTIIVGSGISGIFTLKHLLEEGNNDVLVLDKNPEPFGVWNINNHPSVIENTYTVSSKLYMTISDFPMPENMPEFPHHSLILKYYNDYATHFKLYPYLKQNCKIISIKKETDKWCIRTTNTIYYALNVVIATGTTNDCLNIPTDPFYKNFTGEMYHSDLYDKIKNVEGKKILLVGGSDTTGDYAMELKLKNKITISIKNGLWFQNRILGAYEPADMVYSRMFDFLIKKIITKKRFEENGSMIETMWGVRGSGIDIWKSKCGYLNSYYVKSREIIEQVSKGIITPENGIKSIDNKKITFETNHTAEFDIILFCTGYKPLECMKFLDSEIVNSMKYKHIFYENDPSIMFTGFIRPFLTSIPMLSELQSRWIANVICGKNKLPTADQMHKETIKDDLKQQAEFPCAHERIKTIVDPYDYCNMIADKIGVKPNYKKILFTNPVFFYKLIFNTWNHHVFRLNDKDPKKRKIALENILETNNNNSSKLVTKMITFRITFSIIIIIIILFGIKYFLSKILSHNFVYKNKNYIKKYIKKLYKIKV